MSLKRVLHRTPAFLAVLALLLMRLASVNGAVACFGSDGHIALEGEHTAVSSTLKSASALETEKLSELAATTAQYVPQQPHSSSCFDIGVTHASEQHAIGTSGHHSPDLNVVALSPVELDLVAPKEVSRATMFARGPPASGGFLLHLRSVILLI